MDRVEINKLLDSLEYIRLVCLNAETCLDCPLRNGMPNECYIKNRLPRYWEIKPKNERWRAFDD